MFSKVDAYSIAFMYACSAARGSYIPMIIACGFLLLYWTHKQITNV